MQPILRRQLAHPCFIPPPCLISEQHRCAEVYSYARIRVENQQSLHHAVTLLKCEQRAGGTCNTVWGLSGCGLSLQHASASTGSPVSLPTKLAAILNVLPLTELSRSHASP